MTVDPMTDRIPVVRPRPRAAEQNAPERSAPEEPHPLRRVLRWAGGTAAVLVLALALAVAVVPALAGARPLTVLSGSMEPSLPVGSTVVVRPEPVEGIAVGDVVTFTDREEGGGETRVVTHRVIEVRPGPEFVTMGDANNAPDQGVVLPADVLGVQWYHVPYVGLLRERLLTPPGVFFGLGAVLLGVAVHLLVPRTRSTPRPRRTRSATES
jgi:signal peptidase